MRQLVFKVGDLIAQIHTGRLGLVTKTPDSRPHLCAEIRWTDDGSTQVVPYTNIVHNSLYRKRT